jgi:hypothetical protein
MEVASVRQLVAVPPCRRSPSRRGYALVFLAHGGRGLVPVHVTVKPTATWIWRQVIEATPLRARSPCAKRACTMCRVVAVDTRAAAVGESIAPRKPERRYGSDIIVDLLKHFEIPYAALNPGASYRGLHDSNYGGNRMPELEPTPVACLSS